MAGEFQAGSVSLELKAQTEQLKTGLENGLKAIEGFGVAVKNTAAQVNAAGSSISASFDQIDRSTVRMVDRFARIASGLIATQVALESLTKGKGLSSLQIEVEAGAKAFQTLFTVMAFMPTPAGVVLATITAIVQGYNQLTKAIDEVEKAQNKLNAALSKRVTAVVTDLAKGDVKSQIQPEEQGKLTASIRAYTQQLEAEDRALREATIAQDLYDGRIGALKERSAELTVQLAKLNATIDTDEGSALANAAAQSKAAEELGRVNDQIATLERNLTRAKSAVQGVDVDALAKKIRNLKEALDFTKTEEQARKLVSTMNDVQVQSDRAIELGLDTPLQATQVNLRATEAALRKIIAAEEDLKKAMALVGEDDELRASLERQLQILQEMESAISGRAKGLKELSQSQINAGNLAGGLARSIGDAVSQGIQNGTKAMDILANVGKNLLGNMLNNLVDQFQKSMTEAFQSIAGAGGEILGGALTAVLGVVGGILSRKKSGSQSFAQIQSQVTSTEAVRGIVAGPTNVAIAAVGEDLMRAMRPAVERLDSVIRILSSIDSKTGRGGGAGFSSPAVAVPTA